MKKKSIEWSWRSPDKIIIYFFISLFFSASMIISLNDKKSHINKIAANILTVIGFIFLLIFQYRQKWIFGVFIIFIVFLISIYVTYYNLKLYYNNNEKK